MSLAFFNGNALRLFERPGALETGSAFLVGVAETGRAAEDAEDVDGAGVDVCLPVMFWCSNTSVTVSMRLKLQEPVGS